MGNILHFSIFGSLLFRVPNLATSDFFPDKRQHHNIRNSAKRKLKIAFIVFLIRFEIFARIFAYLLLSTNFYFAFVSNFFPLLKYEPVNRVNWLEVDIILFRFCISKGANRTAPIRLTLS